MMLGAEGPAPSVIEVLTGSPYGMQLIGGGLPLFDPFGWDHEQGIDAAMELVGWSCERARRPRLMRARGPLVPAPGRVSARPWAGPA